jgi:hypothetical protein
MNFHRRAAHACLDFAALNFLSFAPNAQDSSVFDRLSRHAPVATLPFVAVRSDERTLGAVDILLVEVTGGSGLDDQLTVDQLLQDVHRVGGRDFERDIRL